MIDLWKIPMLSHPGIKARLLINSCASMFDDNMKVMKFSAIAYEVYNVNQCACMIVNVNKCASVFDENFSVMKFTAIAVEVKLVC